MRGDLNNFEKQINATMNNALNNYKHEIGIALNRSRPDIQLKTFKAPKIEQNSKDDELEFR